MKPQLGQVSNLVHYMKQDEMIQTQFNTETLYEALSETDLKTFNMIKWLRNNNKNMKLRNLLIEVGVKPNI